MPHRREEYDPRPTEKAEARVGELEAQHDCLILERNACSDRERESHARVAVLREALRHIALPEFAQAQPRKTFAAEALATLDPAATALTERLKAAEAVCSHALNIDTDTFHIPAELFDALDDWHNVKEKP